jgi:diaminopimelate epimerase
VTRWDPRPRLSSGFYKAHGLGNDYLVFEEGDDWLATPAAVAEVCDRHSGVGSDGIVVLLSGEGRPSLRMFNPDGGEFERSGNGLRILASYLMRKGLVTDDPFEVEVAGDMVGMTVHGESVGVYDVSVAMGTASVGAEAVDLDATAIDEDGMMPGPDGALFRVVPVSVGNPHLVVLTDALDDRLLERVGPYFCTHPALQHGANVQLANPVGRNGVGALIWERGVGRTSASGTSACAVAVACVVDGRLPSGVIAVDMPGGVLHVTVSDDLVVELRGPVQEVMSGSVLSRAGD